MKLWVLPEFAYFVSLVNYVQGKKNGEPFDMDDWALYVYLYVPRWWVLVLVMYDKMYLHFKIKRMKQNKMLIFENKKFSIQINLLYLHNLKNKSIIIKYQYKIQMFSILYQPFLK